MTFSGLSAAAAAADDDDDDEDEERPKSPPAREVATTCTGPREESERRDWQIARPMPRFWERRIG
jgi:hypothetical protein